MQDAKHAPADGGTPDPGWIPEETLSTLLGVDRSVLKNLRKSLPPGSLRQNAHVIEWSESAAAFAATKLGVEQAKKTAPPPELTGAVFSKPKADGFHFPNRTLIQCKVVETGEVVSVKVLSSAKYVPMTRFGTPMTLKIRRSTMGNWYESAEKREPRAQGVW